MLLYIQINFKRKGGRVVDCTGFENQRGCRGHRGFESLPFRKKHRTQIKITENNFSVLIAQLDRAPGFGPGGQRFKSS